MAGQTAPGKTVGMGVNRYSLILDLQFKPIIGDLQSCPTVFAAYGTVLKPNARSGSARDGHGRGQRSFDPVHDQGPLTGRPGQELPLLKQ